MLGKVLSCSILEMAGKDDGDDDARWAEMRIQECKVRLMESIMRL